LLSPLVTTVGTANIGYPVDDFDARADRQAS